MRYLILIYFNFYFASIFSQTFINVSSLSEGGGGGGTVSAIVTPNNNKIIGNIYLFDNWNNKAILTSDNGKSFELNNMNFNAKESKFAAKISNDSIFTFYNLKRVSLGESNYVRYNDTFYLELISDIKLGLLKEFYIDEMAPKMHATTNTILEPAKLVLESRYYFKSFNDNLIPFKLNKKSFLEIIESDQRIEVQKFVKSNKLKYNKINDIVKILNFYNSI
tara:strand:- start:4325 stop:4987 length:663 start_codon:yes stop_codon:yes gene_type:complete